MPNYDDIPIKLKLVFACKSQKRLKVCLIVVVIS